MKKQYRLRNKQAIDEYAKQYYHANKAEQIEKSRLYYQANKGRIAEQKRSYCQATVANRAARARLWRLANKAKIAEEKKRYYKDRYNSDELFKLICSLRRSSRRICKGGLCTTQLLGCTWEEAKLHLERQFDRHMNWDNHGTHWHIDHVIPLSYAETAEEARKLCHYTNLQPLEATENLKKQDKIKFLTSEGCFYV